MNATSLNPTSAAAGKERMKWSASRLKMLLQCPRKFRYAYIDGLPRAVTAPLVFGQTMHEAVRQAHEAQMTDGKFPPVTQLIELFDGAWQGALDQARPLFGAHHPTPERYAAMGHEMLRLFHRTQAHRVPLLVEFPFEIEVAGHRLCGLIDRVDEVHTASGEPALVVVDYKSGSRRPTKAEAEGDLQLTVYALALREVLGLRVERVEFHSLRDGIVLESERDEAAFGWLLGEVLGYASRTVERERYPACQGYWCRWCDFQEQCQAEGIATGRLGEDADDREVNRDGIRR